MVPNVPPREASDRLIIFQVSLNVEIIFFLKKEGVLFEAAF